MPRYRIVSVLAVVLFSGIVAIAVFRPEKWWNRFVTKTAPSDGSPDEHASTSLPLEQVKLSPQAQANLRIAAKPLRLQTFWQTIQLPGKIVDRPGFSDRGVVAPITGVVTKIHRMPGDTVVPGEPLFTLRLVSEALQLAQTELFKASREIEITQEKLQRLSKAQGAVAEARFAELDYQLRRLAATQQAYRLELQTRGLKSPEINGIATGTFLTETEVVAPERRLESDSSPDTLADTSSPSDDSTGLSEVQELKVELGQQVQAGQTLCLLSHHESLLVEGRGFRREVPLLEKAIQDAWPVEIDFMEDSQNEWPSMKNAFTIHHISNNIDPESRTFAFYMPLINQSRAYEKEGRTLLLWHFRPGQRVRLHIRSEKLDNVFVLPADAIVREGPETYVFRQNGDFFDRKPVHVLYEDRRHAVVANDGSVPPGVYVAQNAATQLNRVLKAQRASGQPNMHVHADGTVHANH